MPADRRSANVNQQPLLMADPSIRNDLRSICDDFEAAWKSGPRPSIDASPVRVAESDREQLLTELLQISSMEAKPPRQINFRFAFPSQRMFDCCGSTLRVIR